MRNNSYVEGEMHWTSLTKSWALSKLGENSSSGCKLSKCRDMYGWCVSCKTNTQVWVCRSGIICVYWLFVWARSPEDTDFFRFPVLCQAGELHNSVLLWQEDVHPSSAEVCPAFWELTFCVCFSWCKAWNYLGTFYGFALCTVNVAVSWEFMAMLYL